MREEDLDLLEMKREVGTVCPLLVWVDYIKADTHGPLNEAPLHGDLHSKTVLRIHTAAILPLLDPHAPIPPPSL